MTARYKTDKDYLSLPWEEIDRFLDADQQQMLMQIFGTIIRKEAIETGVVVVSNEELGS
jgi:hypothetical protein